MKTEQELKDALEDIFFDALTDKSNPPYYTDKVDPENDGYWQCKVYELCADELIKRGYGDVSEYKTEIERLKEKNNELTDNLVFYKDKSYKLERSVDKLKTEIEQEVKQTRIDVLNELKKKTHNYYPSIDSYCISQHVVLVSDIDKLIAEVEKQ